MQFLFCRRKGVYKVLGIQYEKKRVKYTPFQCHYISRQKLLRVCLTRIIKELPGKSHNSELPDSTELAIETRQEKELKSMQNESNCFHDSTQLSFILVPIILIKIKQKHLKMTSIYNQYTLQYLYKYEICTQFKLQRI